MTMGIKAITFDLWDTVLIDESDELKRQKQGLKPKNEERQQILWEALNTLSPIDKTVIDTAFKSQEVFYRELWLGKQITPNVADRFEFMLEGLERELPASELDRLVSVFQDMEVKIPPDIIAGAAGGLRDLSHKYNLGVVSDAIYTPGSGLRAILDAYEVLSCFSGFAFSDEVGRAKPNALIFTHAAQKLEVKYHEMIHVGDRELNDVQGAQALGMKAILFTGARDESREMGSQADAIAKDYAELSVQIETISAEL